MGPLIRYDATPSGRILSRYTSDIGVIDLTLAIEADNLAQIATMTLILLGLVCAQQVMAADCYGWPLIATDDL